MAAARGWAISSVGYPRPAMAKSSPPYMPCGASWNPTAPMCTRSPSTSKQQTAACRRSTSKKFARRSRMPVFPTNALNKKPLTPNGFKDATTDEARIRDWWGRWPNAMVAAPTGSASGMWVTDLDLDPVKKVDGMATLAQLIAQHGEIPKTLMTITPPGGRHLIFVWDSKVEIRN